METLNIKQQQFNFFSELFIRLVCLVFLFAFIDTSFQYNYLIGENGYAPVNEFLKSSFHLNGISSFFKFPGLFWISGNDSFIAIILTLAAIAALLGLLGIYSALNISIALVCWLSLINSGSDFFIYVWDTLLFEAGIIALIISFLKTETKYHRVLRFLLFLFIFRFWFSMGFVTVCYNESVKVSGTFMKYFFQNQPMPTNIAFYLYHLPDKLQQTLSGVLLFIELIVPFFIFFKRLRALAFFLFFLFSLSIQLVGNYAWFNILTIFICLPLLMESKYGEKLYTWLNKICSARRTLSINLNQKLIAVLAYFQISLQLLLLLFLFFPIGNRYLNFLNYYNYQPEFIDWKNQNLFTKAITLPIYIGSNFKLANPYGVFKGIPVKRWEIEFELYNDTLLGSLKKVSYEYKPGLSNSRSFYAPHFPRLEQQLFYEAQQGSFNHNYTPFNQELNMNCWSQKLISNLKINTDYRSIQTHTHSQKFSNLKIIVSDMCFNSIEGYNKTGDIWIKKTVFSYFTPNSSLNCALIPDTYFSKFKKHEAL